ncbi:MAG: alpha/beta hydrolase [Spirochaetes bacterium]|nr:MAG: alpha/beta hydrolase [Spirochaetota bacterium]
MKNIEPAVRTQSIGDTSLQYLDYEGDGAPILLLHATGFLPWMWHPIARELAGDHRVIAPYFCDHRYAEPEEGGLEWLLLAEDLCRLCTSLAIEDPFLVGHSMGGTVITLANALHGQPARAMVLIEPIFLPEELYSLKMSVDQHPLASKSIKRRSTWENDAQVREYLRSRKLFRNWDEEMLELYIRYGMVPGENGGLTLACSPRHEAALFMGSVRYNPWPLLEKIQCPVMVVEGGESENRHFIDLGKASARFPRAVYRVVPGAGHLVPMEKPKETIALIKEML